MKLEKKHENNKFVVDAANKYFKHVGNIKIYQSFTTHRYTPSTCQIYHKWIVHEHKCLSSFLFFRLSSNWERERVYEIGYKEKRSQSLVIFFLDGFRWRIFPLLRANRLYAIFNTGLKKWLLRVRDILFVFFYPEYLVWFRPPRTLSNN